MARPGVLPFVFLGSEVLLCDVSSVTEFGKREAVTPVRLLPCGLLAPVLEQVRTLSLWLLWLCPFFFNFPLLQIWSFQMCPQVHVPAVTSGILLGQL